MTGEPAPTARVTLDAIYNEVLTLREDVTRLKSDLPHHVTITKDKQEEYETRLANHGTRLGDVEHRLTRAEMRIETLEAERRPRPPWWVIVSAVVAIVGGIYATITFLELKP